MNNAASCFNWKTQEELKNFLKVTTSPPARAERPCTPFQQPMVKNRACSPSLQQPSSHRSQHEIPPGGASAAAATLPPGRGQRHRALGVTTAKGSLATKR